MHRVVVNSTPIIVLSNLGLLELLHKLYKKIYIPQAVFNEVTSKDDSASYDIKNKPDWIHVCKIEDESDKKMYQAKLHAGEVEVMILAQKEPLADLVIIDDNSAKKTAKYLGLKVTGTLGVILKAKKLKYIDNVSDIMEQMVNSGFYISQEVKNIVKKEAGE